MNTDNFYYKFTLCKANHKKMCYIPVTNMTYTKRYKDYDELSLTIPNEIYSQNLGTQIPNPAWKHIRSGQIVLMEQFGKGELMFSEYFSVQDPSGEDGTTGNAKTVTLIPSHQRQFNKTRLNDYSDTRKLFDFEYVVSDDGEVTISKSLKCGYPIPIVYDSKYSNTGGVINYIIENCLNRFYTYNDATYTNGSEWYGKDLWKVVYFDHNLIDEDCGDLTPAYIRDTLLGGTPKKEYDTIETDGNYEVLTQGISTYWNKTTGDGGRAYANWYQAIIEMEKAVEFSPEMTKTVQDLRSEIQGNYDEVRETCNIDNKGNSQYLDLLKDAYTGNITLSIIESIMTSLKSLVDIIVSVNDDMLVEYTHTVDYYSSATMDLYDEFLNCLYSPMLKFKTASNKLQYRALELNDNLTSVFESLADAYNCVFIFNNVNKEISIYSRDNEAINDTKSLIISDRNWMMSATLNNNTEDVITRLRVTGDDDLTIAECNPTGQTYVDNFAFYKSLEYMSQDLIDTLDIYEQKIADAVNEGMTYTYYDEVREKDVTVGLHGDTLTLSLLVEKRRTQNGIVAKYKSAYDQINTMYEEFNSYVSSSGKYKEEDVKIQSEALSQQEEAIYKSLNMLVDDDDEAMSLSYSCLTKLYNTANNKLEAMNKAMLNFQKAHQYTDILADSGEKLFTPILLAELNNFIFEDTMNVDSVTDNVALYKYAVDYIKYLYISAVTIQANLVNVYDNTELCNFWQRFNSIGDFAYVNYPLYNLHYEPYRMLELTHSIGDTDSTLTLNLGNTEERTTSLQTLTKNIWAYAYKTAQDTAQYKKLWREYEKKMNNLLEEGKEIDASVNNIINNKGVAIINADGVVPSTQAGNSIKTLSDGLYCKTSKVATLATDGSDIVVEQKPKRSNLIFSGATITDNEELDTTTVQIDGGGSGDGGTALYVPNQVYSSKLSTLIDLNSNPNNALKDKTIVLKDGTTITGDLFFWQEVKNTTPNTIHKWYVSVVGKNIVQATDYVLSPLYYGMKTDSKGNKTVDKTRIQTTNPTPKAVENPYKVMVYATTDYCLYEEELSGDGLTITDNVASGFEVTRGTVNTLLLSARQVASIADMVGMEWHEGDIGYILS